MPIAAIRYNNPFNISLPRGGYYGGSVVGIVNQPGYASFPNMATGYAAGAQRVTDYVSGNTSYGNLNTISRLGNIYAEGPQGGQVWAGAVSKFSGIPLNQTLDPNNAAQMQALQSGILQQEIGGSLGRSIASQYGNGLGSMADGPADASNGFQPGSTEAAPQGGAADPFADPQAGGEAAPMGGANPNDLNAGNGGTTAGNGGTAAGNGGGGGSGGGLGGAAGGQAIPINLQVLGPGTTQPITGWVDKIMKGFGQEAQNITTASIKTVDDYFSNLLGGISNWFVRAFLILLGIIIVAIGLIVLMWDHGGEQVASNVRKAVKA